ncbi:DUF4145 domain-containing protein [Xylocopilactobacillus apicola]|uniref:DUF4145 domain-containing protein n=1 Tax=Xylocopilactobacillus apicola TaxID=2932184 RepID=A0AAU9D1N6_9LACO|nr:DUF4145 domain-containing protein [Xylocopilactobacillus apicola]BDR57624.1 hypothetical protein XA3_00650 [Xylocopilactobacillus apicola]
MSKTDAYFFTEDLSNFEKSSIDLIKPAICGYCNMTGDQKLINTIIDDINISDFAGVTLTFCYNCKNISARFLFYNEWEGNYTVAKSAPAEDFKQEDLNSYIEKEYPEFSEIYKQSQIAETNGLNQVAGIAYRKSLEFLVSDFLLKVQHEDENWVNDYNTSLSQKIEKLGDQRIKTLAKASSWLGNDQAHYSKRHPEFDVEDLKAFIKVMVLAIENDYQISKAEALINRKKEQ